MKHACCLMLLPVVAFSVAMGQGIAAAAGSRSNGALVVATNILDPDENRALAFACASYAGRRGRRLVFRPHPVEPDGLYRAVITRAGLSDAAVARDAPLEEVLADAAVVVMSQSGVGVDALAARVPFVYVNLAPDVPDYIPYVRYGAAAGVRDLARRAVGFADNNMHAEVVNGMDALAVHDAVLRGAALCREGKGPVFLDVRTYRYYGHSLSDPRNEYRTREEEAAWKEVDPVETLKAQLLEAKVTDEAGLEAIAARSLRC